VTVTPLIVNFTPTGMIPTKEMTPHVPISPSEIVEQVHSAYEKGQITIVHLHARDGEGVPTFEDEYYVPIMRGVRKYAPEVIACVSTSGRTFSEFEKRAAPLFLEDDLKPDMGSLTLSSLNFTRQASVNEPSMIQKLAETMRDRGIIPELEAFDLGMVNYAGYLIRKGYLRPPHYFNLIFGGIAGAQADLSHVGAMLAGLPEECWWSFGGVGDSQLTMNSMAIVVGGGVRVGLEDHIYFDPERRVQATNYMLLQRISDLAEAHGRSIMDPADLRKVWGI